jgi:hypothetical protein
MPASDPAREVHLGIKKVHFMVKKVRLGIKKVHFIVKRSRPKRPSPSGASFGSRQVRLETKK